MKQKVLFVDDEPRLLNSMRSIFRSRYEVLLANSGPQALELLSEHDIQVIVSDERMPVMRGHELLTRVKRTSPSTVRILLTGYTDLKALEYSINQAEIFRYLNKPWQIEELMECVASAADASKRIILPKPADPDEEITAIRPIVTTKQSCAVLVLDVGPATTNSLLANFGEDYEFYRAETPEQAIKMLEGSIDIGVLMMDTDQSDRLELIHELHKSRPELVVIAVTRAGDVQKAGRLVNLGQVYRYLTKPLGRETTRKALEDAVKRHDAIMGNETLTTQASSVLAAQVASNANHGLLSRIKLLTSRLARRH